jgi:hypothetical protein
MLWCGSGGLHGHPSATQAADHRWDLHRGSDRGDRGGAAYLQFADLSGRRGLVERLASGALGRELRIAGDFSPDVGLTTRLVATDVTLANPPWTLEPAMVAVERIDSPGLLPHANSHLDLTIDKSGLAESDAEGRVNT